MYDHVLRPVESLKVEKMVGVCTIGVPAKLRPYLLNTGFMHENGLSRFVVGSVLLSTKVMLMIKFFYYASVPNVDLKFIVELTPLVALVVPNLFV